MCVVYSEVMEGLELRAGLSFLNVGSGTGYLSTLAGLVLGAAGLSHGVELHPAVLQYANRKLQHFMENSPALDEFDFCEPKFYLGQWLSLVAVGQPILFILLNYYCSFIKGSGMWHRVSLCGT